MVESKTAPAVTAGAGREAGMLQLAFYLLVSFLASVAGAICGIGGGVIIKPVLDVCGLASVSTISFLSGLTVLSMSLYSVARNMASGGSRIDTKTGTPLAVGAAAGGVIGKQLFSVIRGLFADPNTVGAVQAACLAVITLGTLLYTIFKGRIQPRRVEGTGICLCIGLVLGIMSSFLGIGGGPINLVVLYYFFSMDTKTAAANSLYIIFFSQLGRVAVISGIVMAVCTMKGYEMLGGKLTKKGIVISFLMMLIMTYIGDRLDWAIIIAREWEVDFFTGFQYVPSLIQEGIIEGSNYWGNLALLYIFTIGGAIPTSISIVKEHKKEGEFGQIGSPGM